MADYSDYTSLGITVDQEGVAVVEIPVAGSAGRRQAEVHKEVSTIWTRLGDDDDVKAILVTGAGDEFYCSADIQGLKAFPGIDKETTFELIQRLSKEGLDIVYRMVELDKPIVAAINGPASGGGLAIALLADISIAAHDAELVDPHVAMGLAAGDHAAMIWPLLCGMAKSKLYLLTSDPVTGSEAERIGLVSLSVPSADVLPTAMDYARRLATGPAYAIRYTKKALNQWLRLGGITAMDYSGALELLNFFGPELREAVERSTPADDG
ncbi:MAG: enoyl-CoA hydratase [Actinomycetia bacterium]|nr:enoyl-CoA hydratase [Actinomycetes bacterium]